jgi:hypothetical protein
MGDFIYGNASSTPGPANQRGPAVHNGLAIAAFITVWVAPFIGFILGCVSVNEAHKNNRSASALAGWAVALGGAFTILCIVIIAVLVHDASQAANVSNVCTQANPNWPYC